MADLNVSLILRLIDMATGPAAKAARGVQRMGGQMTEAGQRQVAWANRQRDAVERNQTAMRGQALEVAGLAASLYGLTEPAVQAEKRMAEVAKVVDFQNANGFSLLADDIARLVTTDGLATTAAGVTDIVAAAGRMGVVAENLPDAEKRRQLLEFAAAASKMSVAFGISAEESGVALARWRQNLSLSQQDAILLGDAVNVLGNTMATSEADIVNVINRQGTVAKTAGLAARETAALSAAILAAGASPEIASTGLKNFVNAMTKGESATKRQSKAFEQLGIDETELAKRMQTDATGAIFSVLEAFQKIEPYRRNSMIGDLFGEEGKGAIAPLIDNMELFSSALAKVSDANAIAGATEEEYARQAATTAAQRQLFLNQLERMGVLIGTQLLPVLTDMMSAVAPIIGQIGEWAAANTELVKTLGWVAVSLLGLKVASLALTFPLSLVRGGFASIVRAVGLARTGLGRFLRIFGLLASRSPVRWARLIPKLKWAAYIPGLNWASRLTKLAWSALISPLKWSARFLPFIPWGKVAGKLSWKSLITPLVWAGKAGLRFIPVIGWALLAGELLWNLLIKPLGWDQYIPEINWDAIFSFEWVRHIPKLAWGPFIPAIDWAGWFNFFWPDVLPKWSWSDIVPDFKMGWSRDAEAEASTLHFKFQELDGTTMNPAFNTSQLDTAIKKAERMKELTDYLNSTSLGGAAGGAPADGVQKRAGGGGFGPGWLMTGEQGPELEYRSKGGWILHNQGLQRMVAMSDRVRKNAASTRPITVAQGGGRASVGGGAATTINVGDIHVHAAPGQDAAEIARNTHREFRRRVGKNDAALHDGGLYD